MSEAYDPALREIAEKACWKAGVTVRQGVYIALTGPSYETPAEIRMFRTLGADAVGMSTVPEVIAARHMGMRVLGISCITNMAAGVIKKKLDHREVLEVGEQGAGRPASTCWAASSRTRRSRHEGGRRRRRACRRSAPAGARGAPRARTRPFSQLQGGGGAAHAATGEIVTGCNIENASYGLTLCAERVAVFKAVSEGMRGFDAIAVAVDSPKLAAPCGPCRQILWEFCGDIWVHMVDLEGHARHACGCRSCCRTLRPAEPLRTIDAENAEVAS